MSSANSWLQRQRKSDLVDLAETVGLQSYEAFKKAELETALDQYISVNQARFATHPDLTGYFNSRSKALGSPVKKEAPKDADEKPLKVARRRPAAQSKLSEEITSETPKLTPSVSESRSDEPLATSTALLQTPGRNLSQVAARIPLPATPADVALAVDRSTTAVRNRVSSIYQESGITEVSHATRDKLSTVTSILLSVAAFELWNVQREILPKTFAFTIPAINYLGTSDYPVYVTDMFLILTSAFWSSAFTWALTSAIIPSIFGYFFNLSASNAPVHRTRSRSNTPEYVVDPLTFSIAKAVVSYVVYAQRVNFGVLSATAIERLDGAVYGGYKGMLVGAAITGLVSIYDAVLRK